MSSPIALRVHAIYTLVSRTLPPERRSLWNVGVVARHINRVARVPVTVEAGPKYVTVRQGVIAHHVLRSKGCMMHVALIRHAWRNGRESDEANHAFEARKRLA